MRLDIDAVSCGYGDRTVVDELSLTARAGEVLCLLGPNGVGKTTLFKAILGLLPLRSGRVLLDGEDASSWPRNRFARAVGYVPQAHAPALPFTVLDVVTMGRTAHLGLFASPSAADRRVAQESLERLEVGFLAGRLYNQISGGERQMALIARALAQQAQVLILDEPTSSLDFGNQVRVLDQVNRLARDGLCIVMTTHFPEHAFLCSAQVALLQRDGPCLVGPAEEIVTEATMWSAYGARVRIGRLAGSDAPAVPACLPLIPGVSHDRDPHPARPSTEPWVVPGPFPAADRKETP